MKKIEDQSNRYQIIWDLGRRCSYACSYCPPHRNNKTSSFVSYKTLCKTMDDVAYYSNLYWISRHRDAKKPFLYPRVDGTTVDNIHIYNDLKFNLFSLDLGTRFSFGSGKYKFQYNFSNYRQHIYQNVYQYWEYDSLNTIHRYGEFGFDYYRGHSLSLIYDFDKL